MSAQVLVIGLDAAEATLVERWAAEGILPTFARLIREGAVSSLHNSLETLPGAIWPELMTGRSCGKLPLYFHPKQLHTGEARTRAVEEDEVDPNENYWVVAANAGKRVAAIDIPQSVRKPGLNGLQLFEWGLHDRNFRITAEPPEFLDDVRRHYGDHPVVSCDLHGGTTRGYRQLRDDLLQGVTRKTDLLLDVLGREAWDLFTCAYGETHCVGHQFWRFFDETYKEYDPAGAKEFGDTIRSVYQKIDEGIGKLIENAGTDTTVLVFTSHGMGQYTGGPNLLSEVLVRLGMGSGGNDKSEWLRRFQRAVSHVPRPLQPLLRKIAYTGPARMVQSSAGCLLDPLDSPRTKAVSLRNNRCGAIRLNLKGREPNGSVAPGAEAEALIKELRDELLALREPRSGQAIVERVVTATEAFGQDHHPDVPDLMVVFRTDLGRLEECTSPRVGHIRVPIFHPNTPRSGDHTVESRLWIKGPGIPAGKHLQDGNVLDIAPTILSLLGIDPPEFIDGRVLQDIAGH